MAGNVTTWSEEGETNIKTKTIAKLYSRCEGSGWEGRAGCGSVGDATYGGGCGGSRNLNNN